MIVIFKKLTQKFRKLFSFKFVRKNHFGMILLTVFSFVVFPFHQARALFGMKVDLISGLVEYIAGAATNPGNPIFILIYFVLFVVLNFFLWVSRILVHFGAWMVDILLDPQIYMVTLNSPAVNMGWTVIRDFSNMFFILFLLLIAFATILRVSEYSAKSLLPKFIVSVLLINFSAEIAKMVIDFGQIFMYEIKGWMGTFSGASGGLSSVVEMFNNKYNTGIRVYNLEQVLGIEFALVYSVILGFLYIMLAGFLLVRIVTFAILIILSPFAFFSMVLPGMRKYTSQWWSSLIKNSISGPIFLFFIYVSAQMSVSMMAYTVPVTPSEISPISSIVSAFIPYIVSIGMLYAVIPITQELGAAGASKIIGGTAGLGKVVMGSWATAKLAKKGARNLGGVAKDRSEFIRRNHEKVRNFKEKINKAIPGGKVRVVKNKANEEKDKEEKMKKTRAEFGDVGSRNLEVMLDISSGKITKGSIPATPEQKAVTVETAIYNEKVEGNEKMLLGLMPALESALSEKELKENTHKDLNFALMTSKSQKRINNAVSMSDKDVKKMDKDIQEKFQTANSDEKKELVEEQIMRETVREIKEEGKDISKLNNLDSKRVSKVINDTLNSEDKKAFKNRLTKKKQEEFAKGLAKNGLDEKEYNQLEADSKDMSKTKKERDDAKAKLKKDEELKIDAVNFGAGLTETFEKAGKGFEEHIKKSFDKFNPEVVAKFSDADLEKYSAYATSSQCRRIYRDGKEEQFEIIKKAKENKKKKLLAGNTGIYKSLLKNQEKLKTEKDPKEIAIIENEIIFQKGLIPKLEEIMNLEKQIDNMESMIIGAKF